ncbi:MAG: YbfB/YjiJ family MFS transporter, partial [Pseudomonadota bacterium]
MTATSCSLATRNTQAVGLAVGGLLALAAAMGIGRFAFTPVLPMMRADAGLSLAAAGWLASANYVGYFVGALAAVWLRIAPGALVRGSLVAIALLTAAMGVTADP